MRISDWSSDVCSSDLEPDADRRAAGSRCPERQADRRRWRSAEWWSPAWRTARRPWPCGNASDAVAFLLSLRSEEHTSELQSLMRISYAVFCLKKKNNTNTNLSSIFVQTMLYSTHTKNTCKQSDNSH